MERSATPHWKRRSPSVAPRARGRTWSTAASPAAGSPAPVAARPKACTPCRWSSRCAAICPTKAIRRAGTPNSPSRSSRPGVRCSKTASPSRAGDIECREGHMATRLDNARVIRAPRGPRLSAKSWLTEAPLRMLMNNLDPEVAEKPHELVVYGGLGRAARDWESYDRIVAALRALEADETLCVQSGKPV